MVQPVRTRWCAAREDSLVGKHPFGENTRLAKNTVLVKTSFLHFSFTHIVNFDVFVISGLFAYVVVKTPVCGKTPVYGKTTRLCQKPLSPLGRPTIPARKTDNFHKNSIFWPF